MCIHFDEYKKCTFAANSVPQREYKVLFPLQDQSKNLSNMMDKNYRLLWHPENYQRQQMQVIEQLASGLH